MGEIKKRLRAVALFGITGEKMLDQMDYAGEAIESEFKALADRIEVLESCPSEGTLLEATIENLQNRIEALESKCGDIGWFMGQVKLNLRSIEALQKFVCSRHSEQKALAEDIRSMNKQIRALEEQIKQLEPEGGQIYIPKNEQDIRILKGEIIKLTNKIKALEKRVPDYSKQGHDVDKFYPPDTPETKDEVPTDKDRPFQVRDIIELFGGGLRSVLKVKSDREMELLDVFTGDRWWSSCPSNYTLVYRPGSPKPEPTVKEKIVTDKFDKPEEGLEKWDVISYKIHYPERPKIHGRKCFGQFHHEERSGDSIWGYWQVWTIWELDETLQPMPKDRVTFEFRPRFPDQKERWAWLKKK